MKIGALCRVFGDDKKKFLISSELVFSKGKFRVVVQNEQTGQLHSVYVDQVKLILQETVNESKCTTKEEY